jgi:hypothetical protein
MKYLGEVPVEEKQITVALSMAELDVLSKLMDAGVKTIGLPAVRPEVLSLMGKFAEAIKSANAQEPPNGNPSQ